MLSKAHFRYAFLHPLYSKAQYSTVAEFIATIKETLVSSGISFGLFTDRLTYHAADIRTADGPCCENKEKEHPNNH